MHGKIYSHHIYFVQSTTITKMVSRRPTHGREWEEKKDDLKQFSYSFHRATTDADVLSEWNYVTNVVLKSPLATIPVRRLLQEIDGAECYKQNAEYLEEADPHAVYPTSIYRSCDGYVLAKPDASVIECIMSHKLTTTIKIVDDVLDPDNQELKNIYQSLGR